MTTVESHVNERLAQHQSPAHKIPQGAYPDNVVHANLLNVSHRKPFELLAKGVHLLVVLIGIKVARKPWRPRFCRRRIGDGVSSFIGHGFFGSFQLGGEQPDAWLDVAKLR